MGIRPKYALELSLVKLMSVRMKTLRFLWQKEKIPWDIMVCSQITWWPHEKTCWTGKSGSVRSTLKVGQEQHPVRGDGRLSCHEPASPSASGMELSLHLRFLGSLSSQFPPGSEESAGFISEAKCRRGQSEIFKWVI